MRRKKAKEQQPQLLPEDVKHLQTSLRKAELHNMLLEEIIRLSEEHTGTDLQKKFPGKNIHSVNYLEGKPCGAV